MFKCDIDVECVFNIPNIVVDVAFKLFIDNVELVLNEFILDNNVVDVAFKFDIDVVWPFTNPNIVVDVVFKFDIEVLLLFI